MSINRLPEQSCPVFNKLTRHEPTIQSKKQHLVSGQLQKNTWPQWAVNLSPRYDHVILVNGYLVLTGVSWSWHGCPIPKKYTVNQGCMSLSTCYLEYGRHVARLRRRRRRAYAPTSNTASHDNHEKINSWVSFCFPYMGRLWGSAWRPFGPPELRYDLPFLRGPKLAQNPFCIIVGTVLNSGHFKGFLLLKAQLRLFWNC